MKFYINFKGWMIEAASNQINTVLRSDS